MLLLACMRDRGALCLPAGFLPASTPASLCLQLHCVPLHGLSSAVHLPMQKGRGFRDQERMEVDDPSIGAYDNPTGRSGKGPAECEWHGPDLAGDLPKPLLAAVSPVSAACCQGHAFLPCTSIVPIRTSTWGCVWLPAVVKSTQAPAYARCLGILAQVLQLPGATWPDAAVFPCRLHCPLATF